jgi:DNA-binding NtrC family response regulator
MMRSARSAGGSVLVVEDDEALRFGLCASLRRLGYDVHEAGTCASTLAAFVEHRPDVVLADMRLPDGDALQLLPQLRALDRSVPILIMTGYGTIDLAVRAVKQGAEDFVTKPVDFDALSWFVRVSIARRRTHQSGVRHKPIGGGSAPTGGAGASGASGRPDSSPDIPFQFRSPAMQRVEAQIERLRDADCSVLLLGETGTGKSVLARHIHSLGARATGPFIDINCGGLTRELVECEHFGHERGAFTGAHAVKQGLFETSAGGTLFLDEIGDVDVLVQPKILKVVEEKRFRRMGDVKERAVDVRLISATHHDLHQSVANKTFRADLYYRISTVTITIPSLRERREDVLPLAARILADLGGAEVDIGPSAAAMLLDYQWPGNLRELKNVLERALLQRSGPVLHASDILFDQRSSDARLPAAMPLSVPTPMNGGYNGPASSGHMRAAAPVEGTRTLSQVEREVIYEALIAENGRVEAAARRLGIPRSTLYQRIKEYGIHPSQFRGRVGSGES